MRAVEWARTRAWRYAIPTCVVTALLRIAYVGPITSAPGTQGHRERSKSTIDDYEGGSRMWGWSCSYFSECFAYCQGSECCPLLDDTCRGGWPA